MADESHDILAVKLDADRRREIDALKERMENFLRSQMEMNNELKLVLKGQDSLKERFEEGVAKRLTGLDNKFDKFMIEWGKKLEQDKVRDERIAENKVAAVAAAEKAEKKADSALNLFNKLALYSMGSVSVGLILSFVIWAFAKFGTH